MASSEKAEKVVKPPRMPVARKSRASCGRCPRKAKKPAISPELGRAPFVDAPTLKAWLDRGHDDAGRPVIMLDTRNAFEIDVGTFDNALDYRLAAAALGSPAAYVGMIGSSTKRARFLSRLAADGVDSARLTCPIGQPGIHGKAPEVIAVATLAQVLALGPA